MTTDDTTQTPLDRLLTLLELDRLDRDLFLGDPGKGENRHFVPIRYVLYRSGDRRP